MGTDQTKWYKFKDDIDCTANAKVGPQPGKIKIPTFLPLGCKTGCTLMWLWSAWHSAVCEIYSNCFDVKIEGVTGGIQDNYPMKQAPFKCIRVNPKTHKTPSFGRYIDVASDGSVTLETVVGDDPKCYKYVVQDGDIMDVVLGKLGPLTAEDIYKKNTDVMKDKNTLPAVGTKLVIEGCEDETTANPNAIPFFGASPASSIYLSTLSVLGG